MATLTLVEVELLLPCLHDLERLERGEVQAGTALRKHFIRVCLGKTPAVTAHENAYLTWRATKPDLAKLKTKLLAAEAQSLTHQKADASYRCEGSRTETCSSGATHRARGEAERC